MFGVFLFPGNNFLVMYLTSASARWNPIISGGNLRSMRGKGRGKRIYRSFGTRGATPACRLVAAEIPNLEKFFLFLDAGATKVYNLPAAILLLFLSLSLFLSMTCMSCVSRFPDGEGERLEEERLAWQTDKTTYFSRDRLKLGGGKSLAAGKTEEIEMQCSQL